MKGQTLLLADDSVTTHRVVELTFAEHGLRVVSVSDGQQAIEKLSTERPDIVLAAINMPKADGYEVARFVKSQPAFEGVPVLLLRGAFDAVDDQRARESGAAGVLVKPIESTIVINRVKELLGMRAKAAPQPALAAGRLVTPAEPPPMRKPTGPRGVGAPASARPESPASDGAAGSASVRPEPPAVARPEPTASAGGAAAPATPAGPQPLRAHNAPAVWDQLREQSGLGPDTPHVEGPSDTPGPDDYFEKLDAAFDNLDAQLSGRLGPPGRGTTPAPAPRMPASIDPAMRRAAEPASARAESPAVASPESSAVARPESAASDGVTSAASGGVTSAASHPPSPARPSDASFGEAGGVASPSAPGAPAAPVHGTEPVAPIAPAAPVAKTTHVADAFNAMLAAEQGEGRFHHAPVVDISDDVIERIAARVAERLSEGVFMDTVTHIVAAVTERLVREEIARIRAAAQAKKE